ncbi:DUF1420 family protein [Leptospira borgpetersenii]|uniref:DUF1420 family protein n=1 Tax=Leptospira borgpetersenii TaxID=174 RepID=UPI0002984605|nr:DUF1420 family protein [Leptospira borgpetersenii]EKQ90135.1 PF07220 family protein [Leptospira borgpetersenii str. UI 09149]QVK52134.1 DUF1420 family protein [Leptospira borgpetersenii]QVK55323.1 DUF1420 family protein [Leptospira borgpetersenii]QVK58517.1 DUF1420 family protein [Leptospira borgpetersenii]QVK61694.1 DUF1420 family protein [Leptospira borgpetersenii]
MKFGLDANVAYPPLSVVYSIFLIFGCDFLGFYILRLFENSLGQIKNSWIRWQAPLTGALLLSVVFYPLALFGLTPRFLMKCVAIFLSVLGFTNVCFFVKEGTKNLISISYYSNIFKNIHYHLSIEEIGNNKKGEKSFFLFKVIGLIKNKSNSINKNDVLNVFIMLLTIGYAFLALCPVTNADSLDYHIGVAIEILNQGKMPVFSGWFHGRLAGNGEVLNALGLAIGAEQFGSLLQFSGLLGIYGILAFYSFMEKGSVNDDSVWRKIIIIAFLSSPVLIFLVSSPKPQLLQIGMTSFAVILFLEIISKTKADKSKLFIFNLICLLTMSVTQTKFSFFLSAFLIGFFSIFLLGSIRLFFCGTLIAIFSFILIIFPSIFWKIENYNSSIMDALVSPLPGSLPGVDLFEVALRSYKDSTLSFPLSLIFPNQFGVITTVIGVGLLLVIFVRPTAPTLLLNVMIFLFVVLGSLIGQKASRFFLEPFVWMLISLISFNSFRKWNIGFMKKVVNTGILLQACATLAIISVGIYQLFPGIFSVSMREKIMSQYANGYSLMKWADLVLPKDAVLLSQHRSISLSQRKTLSLDWASFVDFNSAVASPYLKQIKDENVTHILMFEDTTQNIPFSGCIGNTIGKTKSSQATRNPFNRNDFFTAILVEFQSGKLPECANSIL